MAYAAGFLAAKCTRTNPSLGERTADADDEDVPSDARRVTSESWRPDSTLPTLARRVSGDRYDVLRAASGHGPAAS